MAVRDILRLGHPALRYRAATVHSFGLAGLSELVRDLSDTLENFRTLHGFGRGIAAPQIGAPQRVVVLHGETTQALINPVIIRHSKKQMTLWDDCFSLPDLLAKVRRSLSVEVRYQDVDGKRHTLRAEGALAELLQHEIDHLDGILTVDRAIDSRHIVYKSEYERWSRKGDVML